MDAILVMRPVERGGYACLHQENINGPGTGRCCSRGDSSAAMMWRTADHVVLDTWDDPGGPRSTCGAAPSSPIGLLDRNGAGSVALATPPGLRLCGRCHTGQTDIATARSTASTSYSTGAGNGRAWRLRNVSPPALRTMASTSATETGDRSRGEIRPGGRRGRWATRPVLGGSGSGLCRRRAQDAVPREARSPLRTAKSRARRHASSCHRRASRIRTPRRARRSRTAQVPAMARTIAGVSRGATGISSATGLPWRVMTAPPSLHAREAWASGSSRRRLRFRSRQRIR